MRLTKFSRIILALLLAVFASCSSEQAKSESEQEITDPPVTLWGRWDKTFTAQGDADSNTEFFVQFRAPSGKSYHLPGFWDGEKNFRARIMPDEEGVWLYQTYTARPIDGLTKVQGAFECRKPEGADATALTTHGAVRVARNGRHFEHADGTAFFWLSDTAWNGALLSREADWQSYLNDRAGKGFSAVQFVTTQWRAAPANAEGLTAYSGRDPIEINPEFFKRIDARLAALNAKGLVGAPVLLWALGDEASNPGFLPEPEAVKLARYMVARYSAYHVVWFIGGDADYAGENAPRWKRIGRALFRSSEHAPTFLHPRGMRWPWDEYESEEWLSALGYQSGHGDDAKTLAWIHSGAPSTEWQKGPAKPVVNLEPPYEDHVGYQSKERHTAYNVRRASYWSLMVSPTAGVSYGVHGVWSWETEPRVPLNHERSGVAKPWNEAVQLPGSTHMKHLRMLFDSLQWWKLRPAQDLLASQPGAADPAKFVTAAASEDDAAAVLYLPAGGEIALNAQRATGFAKAEWFDPRTSERKPAQAAGANRYQAPGAEDWVLVLSGN